MKRICFAVLIAFVFGTNAHAKEYVKNSRMGSVDLAGWDAKLSESSKRERFLVLFCNAKSPVPKQPTLVTELNVENVYGGYDQRIEDQKEFVNHVGSACFAGNLAACEKGKEYFLAYAKADAPKRKKSWSSKGRTKSLDQYVMNTHFISHAVNFLSIYQYKAGFSQQEFDVLDDWLRRMLKEFGKNHNNTKIYSKYGINVRETAQNHYLSSADSYLAVGSWLGNDNFFKIGLDQWHTTLKTMRADGSLPHETARGSRAIWYTGISLTKLVRLAELARVQGIDLYEKDVDGKTFHDAVAYFLDAVIDPTIVHKYAKANRDSGGSRSYLNQEAANKYSGKYAWIKPYLLRFPNHKNTKRIFGITGHESEFAKVFVTARDMSLSNNNSLNLQQSCFYFDPL